MEANYFTILQWFCHKVTWISHGCTCVSYPEPPAHLPPHPIPLDHPSAPALSALSHELDLDWQTVSHMVIYMLQCYSLRSSHPHLPQSPKSLFFTSVCLCCLAYRVLVTIFLNPIYICVSILYWCFSFWLTSLCKIGSSFINLIRTDSNVFFFKKSFKDRFVEQLLLCPLKSFPATSNSLQF